MDRKINTIYGAVTAKSESNSRVDNRLSRFKRALTGARDVAPILPGVIPFGMVAGAGALSAGFTAVEAQGMSLILFAGASQVAAIDLIGRGVAWPAILFAIMIVNMRFAMYSAAIATVLPGLSKLQKTFGSYLLTDQGFAVTINRHRLEGDQAQPHLFSYYIGASLALWSTWQLGTFAGIVLGAMVPPSWDLDFTIPLMFLALLSPTLRNRSSWTAALTAGLIATVGRGLPHNMSLMMGALAGVAMGLIVEWRSGAGGVKQGEER